MHRSNHPKVFCKKVFIEISQNSQENTCAGKILARTLKLINHDINNKG